MSQAPDFARLGRLPSGKIVIAHSFGLTVDRPQVFPYCSCGWVSFTSTVAHAEYLWEVHLAEKDEGMRAASDLPPL